MRTLRAFDPGPASCCSCDCCVEGSTPGGDLDVVLREDGGVVLREDGGLILREVQV